MTYAFDPDWVVRPGATLQEWMDVAGVEMVDLASVSGLRAMTVYGILHGTVEITPTVAEGLERGTHISVDMWLNLERIYRAGLAAGKSDVS